MLFKEYLRLAQKALINERISPEAYDCMIKNADCFCEVDDDTYYQLPKYYTEVEYDDFDNSEAIDGAKFDYLNYLRYKER